MQRRAFLTSLGFGVAAGGAAYADFAKPIPKPSSGADLDRWKQALAGARLYAITRLREYRAAGQFPRNHRILRRVPTFIDAQGRPCAVGYLMQRSGHQALAAQIANATNNIYIEQIQSGPALDWIKFSGLTQSECAYIQPSYDWHEPPVEPIDPDNPTQREAEQLRAHFDTVVTKLLDNTAVALTAIIATLEPLIATGASIDRVSR
jgi:hypothetical protein